MSDEKSVREKLTHKGLTGPWKRSPEIQRKSRDSCGDFATRIVVERERVRMWEKWSFNNACAESLAFTT
jgi:hypothetical protein